MAYSVQAYHWFGARAPPRGPLDEATARLSRCVCKHWHDHEERLSRHGDSRGFNTLLQKFRRELFAWLRYAFWNTKSLNAHTILIWFVSNMKRIQLEIELFKLQLVCCLTWSFLSTESSSMALDVFQQPEALSPPFILPPFVMFAKWYKRDSAVFAQQQPSKNSIPCTLYNLKLSQSLVQFTQMHEWYNYNIYKRI